MNRYRYYCDECQNEYEVEPINEPTEEIKPIVCAFCESKIDDWFYDDVDDE